MISDETNASNQSQPRPSKRVLMGIIATVVVLGGLLVWCFLANLRSQVGIALADGRAEVLEEMRGNALGFTNVTDVARILRDVCRWYGNTNSEAMSVPENRLLVRVKQGTAREIIAHLRSLTGKDLGDDSAQWVAAYAPPEK